MFVQSAPSFFLNIYIDDDDDEEKYIIEQMKPLSLLHDMTTDIENTLYRVVCYIINKQK